jgi:TM2 domain-containing membrane protein YozV
MILHILWIRDWTDGEDFYNLYRDWLLDIYFMDKKEAVFQEFVMGRIMWAFLAAHASDFESFYLQRTGNLFPLPASPTQESSKPPQQSGDTMYAQSGAPSKSKLIAGVLGVFLGQFGVHNFYLGFRKKAIFQLALFVVGYVMSGSIGTLFVLAAVVWGIIDGIQILSGSSTANASGNPLR